MFTNEAEQQQVQREGTFGHMFKRFTSLAILVAILGGGYSLLTNGDDAAAEVAEIAEPATAALNPVDEPQDVVDGGANIVQGLAQTMTNVIQQSRNGQGFQMGSTAAVTTTVQDDGLENSFYDLTYQNIENMNGQSFGQITDVLIDPQTGAGMWVVFRGQTATTGNELANVRYAVPTAAIAAVTASGDLQISDANMAQSFAYTPEIYDTTLSLKNLRGAPVIDGFNNPVGRITNLIYRNNRLETVYISLAEEMAPNGGRFEFPAADVGFQRQNGQYQMVLNENQTAQLAEKLYAKN